MPKKSKPRLLEKLSETNMGCRTQTLIMLVCAIVIIFSLATYTYCTMEIAKAESIQVMSPERAAL